MKPIYWVNFILGVWLIASPFVLRFNEIQSILYMQVVLGILIAAFAFYSAAAPKRSQAGVSGVIAFLGILTILAPFATRYALPEKATVSDVIVGIAVFVLAAYNALSTPYHFPIHRAQH